jgi:hypothetical protein
MLIYNKMNLEEIYLSYNYPGVKKLYQLQKLYGLNHTLKQVNEFIKSQPISQMYNRKVNKPSHIVAFHPDELILMDLIDMQKFSKQNKGYKYILLIIDIFTRKLSSFLLRNKTITEIYKAIKSFLNSHHNVHMITSDNEPAFMSKKIQDLLEAEQISHRAVDVGNHRALGAIDRAVLTIKRAIYKYMYDKDTLTYYKQLENIIDKYNETPHEGIDNLTPNQVHNHIQEIQVLNHRKYRDNIENLPGFKIGDIVRIEKLKQTFTRGYDRLYSKNTYRIIEIKDGHATLSNNVVYPLRRLKLVPTESEHRDENKIKQAKQQHKQETQLKREDIKAYNIQPMRTRGKRVQAIFK